MDEAPKRRSWSRDLLVQLALYLVVGFFATVTDLGGFALLKGLGLPFVVAAPISFLAGTLLNYVASYTLAFQRGRYGRFREIGRLALVVALGAVLNTAFAYGFMAIGLDDIWAKAAAIPCVFAWNFLGRRWLVFSPDLPAHSKRTVDRVLGRSKGTAR